MYNYIKPKKNKTNEVYIMGLNAELINNNIA